MKEYHILSLSGGKDSTALAFFMKENMPDIFEKTQLVFCDTECELPEIYDYLNKVELFLNKPIKRIKPPVSFEQMMEVQNFLPTPHRRWCTIMMKTTPFKKYIYDLFKEQGEGIVNLYIGIRADEQHRAKTGKYGDNSIKEIYPFVENYINREDVFKILEDIGIGLPEYYKWTSRSGCYFCFFKSQLSWILLNEYHPDLYKKAMEMEEPRLKQGGFGWNIEYSLKDMIKPQNIKKIKEKYKEIFERKKRKQTDNRYLIDLIEEFDNQEIGSCIMCHL